MKNVYIVGLNVVQRESLTYKGGPVSRFAPKRIPVPAGATNKCVSHYVLHDAELAGELLNVAVSRGAYTDALSVINGSGLGSRTEQRHGAPVTQLTPGDMWALVVYAEHYTQGVGFSPYVVFGDHRHRLQVRTLDLASPNQDTILPMTDGGPGVMLHEAARLHGIMLFANQKTANDIQF